MQRERFDAPEEAEVTKKQASLLLQVIAAEIRLALQLDESDEDCPSWAADIEAIAKALHGGGA